MSEKRFPDHELVRGWADRALELAEPGSRPQAQAELVLANQQDDVEAADRAIAIGERLDDIELISAGYGTRAGIAFVTSEYGEAVAWDRRSRALDDRLTDPDQHALNAYWSTIFDLGLARFDKARVQARRQVQLAERLSAHHVVHAMAATLFVEEATGCWDSIRALQPRVEQSIHENLATPCVLNASLLLSCSVACAELGEGDEARRLERAEEELGMEAYELFLDPLRARLALIRGDLDALLGLLGKMELWHWVTHGHLVGVTTRLDTLVALERVDEVEESAPRLLRPGTYVEPFALRALGRVRGDPALVARAIEGFEAIGLDWHAAQTLAAA